MIVLNIYSLCRLRGIIHPFKALTHAGISHRVAQQYLSGKKKTIVIAHIEILCVLLNCRPDNLFTWQPDTKEADLPNHPLQAVRNKPLGDGISHLQSLSVEDAEKWMGG